jgi:hypothetical protein
MNAEVDVRRISRRALIGVLPAALLTIRRVNAQTDTVTVYKDPTCGCCAKWVDLMRREGFAATVHESRDLASIKQKYNVPPNLQSCHTAIVNDQLIVEGHVPPADVKRVLKDKAAIGGLAVPGMPIGSPGMEVADVRPQAYDVIAFTRAGKTRVFASH